MLACSVKISNYSAKSIAGHVFYNKSKTLKNTSDNKNAILNKQ